MAIPVITVASGGLPVVDNTAATFKSGMAVTEAVNGLGVPVTKVASLGLPVIYVTAPLLADEESQTDRDRARPVSRRKTTQ